MLFFLKFFANPKVLLIIAILALFGGAYYKYHSLQSDLAKSELALKQEKDNNVVLRNNIDTITKVNSENAKVIQQQIQSAKTTVETITKLSTELKRKEKSFANTNTKIEAIKDAPVPLSPYLKEAITGIQAERDELNPKEPTK